MGDAGLDECEVVGKLKGAGNEERIEGRSKYLMSRTGKAGSTSHASHRHESWLRLMKANVQHSYPAGTYQYFPSTTYAYPLIGSADFCTTIYTHGYTLIIAPCFSAHLRSIPRRASALIQQSPTPTICFNALSINLK